MSPVHLPPPLPEEAAPSTSLKSVVLRGMTPQDYQQAFLIYLTSLMGAAQRYLGSKGEDEAFDPLADAMELSLTTVNLGDEGYQSLNRRILELLTPIADNPSAPNRKRRFFTYRFLPQ